MSQLRLVKDHQVSNHTGPDTVKSAGQSGAPATSPAPPEAEAKVRDKVTPIHFTAKAEQLQMERVEARLRQRGLWQRFRDWLDI